MVGVHLKDNKTQYHQDPGALQWKEDASRFREQYASTHDSKKHPVQSTDGGGQAGRKMEEHITWQEFYHRIDQWKTRRSMQFSVLVEVAEQADNSNAVYVTKAS